MSTLLTPILEAQNNNLEELLKECVLPVVVDFWAPWCGPCHQLMPVLKEAANFFTGKIQVIKVNIDENGEVMSKYSINKIPTLLLFEQAPAGKLKEPGEGLKGYFSLVELKNILNQRFFSKTT